MEALGIGASVWWGLTKMRYMLVIALKCMEIRVLIYGGLKWRLKFEDRSLQSLLDPRS